MQGSSLSRSLRRNAAFWFRVPWIPEVFSLVSGDERPSERVVLAGERPLAQAVKSFERADPITRPVISPESRFDPGNLIGRLQKRFLEGLLCFNVFNVLMF